MKPKRLDLPVIWRGCVWQPITFTWKAPNGDPFDLTGWTPIVKTRNIDLNARLTDAINGVTTLSLPSQVTVSLKLGREQWDWIWVDPDGIAQPPILSGEVPIQQPTSPLPPPPIPAP